MVSYVEHILKDLKWFIKRNVFLEVTKKTTRDTILEGDLEVWSTLNLFKYQLKSTEVL